MLRNELLDELRVGSNLVLINLAVTKIEPNRTPRIVPNVNRHPMMTRISETINDSIFYFLNAFQFNQLVTSRSKTSRKTLFTSDILGQAVSKCPDEFDHIRSQASENNMDMIIHNTNGINCHSEIISDQSKTIQRNDEFRVSPKHNPTAVSSHHIVIETIIRVLKQLFD